MSSATPFTVAADLPLGPRIAPYLRTRGADVAIARGTVPAQLDGEGVDGPAYQIRDRRVLIAVPEGPRFLIEDGARIVYDAAAGAERDVVLFLLGSAWGALCYQRGLIPLHASAVVAARAGEAGGVVHAFTGRSGAGKSTLAAALAARGRALFTDDVLILDPAHAPRCFAGQKEPKLWEDALALTGSAAGERVRDAAGFDKFYVSTAVADDVPTQAPLASLTLLESGNDAEMEQPVRLAGADVVAALLQALYRPAFGSAILGRRALYAAAATLAPVLPVYRWRRAMDADRFDAGVTIIDAWIAARD